eukprot:TRINITY_DN1664_c0_g1_i8.p2 TRINITY_DN1664_c0_g1~~TRINITY_DN1664_c0_g1_i8.p2  ORF type:complete len:163 (+),score=30.43 TRINITY_DN1664_c0_g1_i8:75-563(+)
MFAISSAKPIAAKAVGRVMRVAPRAVARPDEMPEFNPEAESPAPIQPKVSVNPKTGNPQTGKLLDVYFEVGAMLVVVAVALASWFNAQDVLKQTASADSVREPASKQEWLALDSKGVYGPCGGNQGSDAAIEDMLEGRPCTTAEYARFAPSPKMQSNESMFA